MSVLGLMRDALNDLCDAGDKLLEHPLCWRVDLRVEYAELDPLTAQAADYGLFAWVSHFSAETSASVATYSWPEKGMCGVWIKCERGEFVEFAKTTRAHLKSIA